MITSRRAIAWTLALLVAAATAGVPTAAPVVYADSGDPPGFLTTLGGAGHAMIYPSGGEIAPDGTIIVADTGNDRVAKFSADGHTQRWTVGTPGKGLGQFMEPRDAGVASTGNIYIADTGNARIVELSPTGTWITWFNGPKTDHLSSPIGISVSNDLIYVADGLQKKVFIFDLSGNLVLQVASNGVCSFSRIRDADADAAGNIYVADYLNDDILKLSPAGICITKWGSFGTGNGQFKNPYGVRLATDPVLGTQAVYVADSNNNRIQEFTTAGVFVASMGGPGIGPGTFTQLRRVAVATDGSGDVWGADPWGFQMERFHRTPTGYTYAQTIGAVPPPTTATNIFNQPRGISFDTAGDVAVVDTVNQRIDEFSPTGSVIGTCGQRGFGKAEDNWPRGVAIDQTTGQLWIADTKQSRLIILKPAPDCSSVITLGNGQGTALNQFHWPFSIAIRQSDRIAWVADTKNNRITSYNVMTRAPIATFGTLGSGTGQFNSPSGIAVVPGTGHILVADTNNDRIVELSDTSGGSITVVRTLTDAFSSPQGVAADSLGQIYVADTNNNRVVVLKPDGTERGTVSGFNQPQNLAVNAADDKLYVADTLNDRVQVYSYPTAPPPGIPTYVSTLVGPGLASMYPVDVTSTAQYYYVMDPGRYRVSRIVRSTGLIDLETHGGQGKGPSQFSDARAIDVDSAGNVYVADTANNRVQVFDKDLNFLRQWGSSGTGNGQFNQDYGLGIGMGIGAGGLPAEVAYITDGTGRVQKFDLNGNYLGQFSAILNQPRQLTVDPVNQDVYVMDARNRRAVVFDENGNQLFTFGSSGTGPGQFSDDPRGIGVSADGSKAFATDSGGKRVLVFNALTGAYLYQVGGPGIGAGQFVNPRGLTVTTDGKVMVTDEFGYGVHEFTLAGTPVRDLFGSPPPIPGVDSPRGIEVSASGRIYNVDWWNQRIDSINANGSSPSAFGFRGTTSQPGSINFAWDLAIQPGTGRIFVANRESHEIEVFKADGTYVTRWGTRGTADGQMQFPQGDTFAPDGTLLVSDTGNGRIERFSIAANGNGTWVATYGAQGPATQGVGFLNVPTGISTASDGTIWVADTLNNSVQSMSPLGVWTRYTAPGGTHLRAPWGITVAPDSSIWISDTGNARLVKMENTGVFDWAATGPQMGAGAISPFAVAFGQGKHVYLSDTWHNRVIDLVTGTSAVALNPTFVRNVGSSAHAGIYAWGAATEPDGSVLIGDYWNLRVSHFAKNGTLLGQIIDNPGFGAGQNQEPYGIGIDPVDGDIYLAQATIPTVMKYDSNGNFLFSWGKHGTTNGAFTYPSRVVVAPNQNVYVVDSWAHQVDVYDKSGLFLFKFGALGAGPGQFKQPHGAAFDGLGRLWIADQGNYRVEVFDQAGNFLFQVGSRGTSPGQFKGDLRGVAIDQVHGWAYVVDALAGRIDRFDMTGAFLSRWGSIGTGPGQFEDGAREITVDGDGNVWTTDLGGFRAMKFDPLGNLLLTYPAAAEPPALGGFNGPRGVAVDSSGNVFVSDTYNWRMEKFDSTGAFIRVWGTRGPNPGQFNYARLIAIDPTTQDVVVADSDSNAIDKYDNDGNLIWCKCTNAGGATPGKFQTPYGVAVDATGRIWVADSNNNRVQVLDANGNFLFQFGTKGTGPGEFNFPRGIGIDTDGSVWVSDQTNDDVQHFSSAGSYLGTIGSKGTGPGQMSNPFGVQADGTYVYVADSENNRVDIFTEAGAFVMSFGLPGTKTNRFNRPSGLWLRNGMLYIADQLNDRIDIWSLT